MTINSRCQNTGRMCSALKRPSKPGSLAVFRSGRPGRQRGAERPGRKPDAKEPTAALVRNDTSGKENVRYVTTHSCLAARMFQDGGHVFWTANDYLTIFNANSQC